MLYLLLYPEPLGRHLTKTNFTWIHARDLLFLFEYLNSPPYSRTKALNSVGCLNNEPSGNKALPSGLGGCTKVCSPKALRVKAKQMNESARTRRTYLQTCK